MGYLALRRELRELTKQTEPEAQMYLFVTGADCTCGYC